MSKQEVTEAAQRLAAQYGLESRFSMIVIKAGPEDVIVIAAIRGLEHEMPALPNPA
jgi:hypothetical protein